ncbi:MAG: dTDP-4-dehydrorhamnose 3,5-epimerase [Deltaproteobacteria bacterium CG2_30_63_29]|nr:MAG: dTDP-4-dehydrorhamnose 3,5-epimerase [Deltaproteobacteria bacterium CG2_30_63_29]PJB43387.1 MAG: dTDP-4-dehydrorhamnose 3,5-epimerase [Deltaproteobacteria bacterium CG_4_9_14_3_um_filter_63_12]
MKVTPTELPSVLLVEPQVWGDARGYFYESFRSNTFQDLGLPSHFVQDSFSRSSKGTLRGLHLQHPFGQGKLIAAIVGEIFDVAVDVQVGSPTFGRWIGRVLSDQNMHRLYLPPGHAHGFAVLSDVAVVSYRFTEYYHPESELGVAWNDPEIGIDWPVAGPLLSDKDRRWLPLGELEEGRLPRVSSGR